MAGGRVIGWAWTRIGAGAGKAVGQPSNAPTRAGRSPGGGSAALAVGRWAGTPARPEAGGGGEKARGGGGNHPRHSLGAEVEDAAGGDRAGRQPQWRRKRRSLTGAGGPGRDRGHAVGCQGQAPRFAAVAERVQREPVQG